MQCQESGCIKQTKGNHTHCRKHYIGEDRWKEEKLRNSLASLRRKVRHPKHFECEMGYSDCERRGYCNGDC